MVSDTRFSALHGCEFEYGEAGQRPGRGQSCRTQDPFIRLFVLRADIQPERTDCRPGRADFWPKRVDFRPWGTDFRLETLDFRAEGRFQF